MEIFNCDSISIMTILYQSYSVVFKIYIIATSIFDNKVIKIRLKNAGVHLTHT